MEDLQLYGAILAALVVILLGLMFLKSQSSSASEAKTGAVRRRAAIPNRDGDGQIIADGPRQRGPGGGRRRMQRRTQVQEEEPVEDVIDEPRANDGSERYRHKILTFQLEKEKQFDF